MTSSKKGRLLQEAIWNGSLPLEITLSPSECLVYDQADPYLIHYPRLSYLPLLLPRLHAFFTPFLIHSNVAYNQGWFSFEEIPLKWHYPLGLLFDLFSGAVPSSIASPESHDSKSFADENGALPWRLKVHFTSWPDERLVRLDAEGRVLHDAFINSVKEADFLRNGTAKGIMSLSKNDSTQLWNAVQEQNLLLFAPIFQKLLHAQGAPIRNIPLKVYLPSLTPATPSNTSASSHLRVVQSPVPHTLPGTRKPQTLGSALHTLLPALFPSRRTPILARPILHGAVLPMDANLEELVEWGPYTDGWLHLVIIMVG